LKGFSGKSQEERSTFRKGEAWLGPASGWVSGSGGEAALRGLRAGEGARLGVGLPGEDGGASGLAGSLEVLESGATCLTLYATSSAAMANKSSSSAVMHSYLL
jgi:hypothetical protein